jgi:DNA invertase Pin-like site-specific DNA recombinase
VTDLLATLKELSWFRVADRSSDLTTPAGGAMAKLLAIFAGFEREILRHRVRAGLDHAGQNGK